MSDHFRLLRDLSAVREIVTLLMKWYNQLLVAITKYIYYYYHDSAGS